MTLGKNMHNKGASYYICLFFSQIETIIIYTVTSLFPKSSFSKAKYFLMRDVKMSLHNAIGFHESGYS